MENSLPRDEPETLGVSVGLDPLIYSDHVLITNPARGERTPKHEAPSGLSAGEGFAHVESVLGALVFLNSKPLDRRYTSPALLRSRRDRRRSFWSDREHMVTDFYRKAALQSS